MISLKPLLPKRIVEAKDWISLRTTSMPRSARFGRFGGENEKVGGQFA
jgi:hypothetical protein